MGNDAKKVVIEKLVWIDLEMSGLDPIKDVILEIAVVVTDMQLQIVAQGPDIVISHSELVIKNMDEWCTKVHSESGLIQKIKQSDTTISQAEQQILGFLREHCAEKKCILAGNSVWMDKMFLMRYMPRLNNFMHYRIIDVSTVKELGKSWYGEKGKWSFKKKNAHRAMDDILESIEELKRYKEYLFI